MVATKETAEERLLRMIEGPEGRKTVQGSGPPRRRPLDLWGRLRGVWAWPRSVAASRGRPREKSDGFLWRLQLAGQVFWVLLTGLALYLVIDLWVLKMEPPSAHIQPLPVGPATGGPGTPGADPLQSLAAYQQAIVGRNPFQWAAGRPADDGQAPVARTTEHRLNELAGSLVIVGVNRGANPEALIEDSKAGRTHFLKVGDQINGLTVKSIDDRGVTLTYEGEEILIK